MDTYPTFHDCKPTHNPLPGAVIDTTAAAIEAWQRFDTEIDRVYFAGRTDPVSDTEYAELNEVRRAAEFVQSLADETAEAYHAGNLTEQRWERELVVTELFSSLPIVSKIGAN